MRDVAGLTTIAEDCETTVYELPPRLGDDSIEGAFTSLALVPDDNVEIVEVEALGAAELTTNTEDGGNTTDELVPRSDDSIVVEEVFPSLALILGSDFEVEVTDVAGLIIKIEDDVPTVIELPPELDDDTTEEMVPSLTLALVPGNSVTKSVDALV